MNGYTRFAPVPLDQNHLNSHGSILGYSLWFGIRKSDGSTSIYQLGPLRSSLSSIKVRRRFECLPDYYVKIEFIDNHHKLEKFFEVNKKFDINYFLISFNKKFKKIVSITCLGNNPIHTKSICDIVDGYIEEFEFDQIDKNPTTITMIDMINERYEYYFDTMNVSDDVRLSNYLTGRAKCMLNERFGYKKKEDSIANAFKISYDPVFGFSQAKFYEPNWNLLGKDIKEKVFDETAPFDYYKQHAYSQFNTSTFMKEIALAKSDIEPVQLKTDNPYKGIVDSIIDLMKKMNLAINYAEIKMPHIIAIYYNNPYTTVKWSDDTVTVVSCTKGEIFSKEIGLAMAIAKKYFERLGNEYPRAAFKRMIDECSVDISEKQKKKAESKKNAKDKEERD